MWMWPFGVHQMIHDPDVWSWDHTAAAQAVVWAATKHGLTLQLQTSARKLRRLRMSGMKGIGSDRRPLAPRGEGGTANYALRDRRT